MMACLIVVEVVARYVVRRSLGIADEFSAYLLVCVTFLGLAYVAHLGDHIRVEVVVSRLSCKMRGGLAPVELIMFLIVALVLTKVTGEVAIYHYIKGTLSFQLVLVPQWIPMSVMAVGFACLTVVLLAQLVRFIAKERGAIER
jgi:TRAP-type C4-dicarboxylate transport system permease small subunit